MSILKISPNLEKDIYETLGFQNGNKPWTDIREGTGILCLISLLNFIERTNEIYASSGDSNYVLRNLLQISKNTSNSSFDGFPMILVFIDVVHRSLALLKNHKYEHKNKYLRRDFRKMEK